VEPPANPGGLIYGTIVVATLLAVESPKRETYGKTIGAVVIALAVYWLAIAYSEFVGHRVQRGEHFEASAFIATARHELAVVFGGIAPLAVLLACWALGATLTTGVGIAVWSAVAAIVFTEVMIGIRAELTGRELVVQTSLGIVLGLLVVALRVLLH
jgi:hypothetical protein